MSDPFKDVPQDIKAVADFLRGGESKLKVRQGVLNGRRVDYFKGKHAVNAILREPYRKKQTKLRPQVSDRPGGEELLTRLFTQKFFVKVQKASKSKQLELVPQPVNFEPESYYAWVYEGSQLKGILIGTGVLLVTFAGVMFPLWPTSLRMGVYYLSLGLLGLMGVFLGIVVVRLLIWLSLKVSTGRDGWLFPNLFEDVGIIDSFIPTWGWDEKAAKKKKKVIQTPASDDENENAGDGNSVGSAEHED